MRVVSLQASGRFAVEERALPPLPAGHARVRIGAAGVCSSDVARSHGGAYHHPLVLGHELAGVVEDGGETGVAPGTRVTIFPLLPCFSCDSCAEEEYARCRDYDYFGSRRDGGFGTHLDVPTWNLLPVPDGVSLDDAALTEPLAVVVHALERLGGEGEVAILGAGFLGLLAAQILHRRGRPVTLLGRHPEKMARALGATTVPEPEHDSFVAAHSDAFSCVLEAVGAPATLRRSLALAAPGGTVVWMGNPSADVELPQALVSRVLRKELAVRGTWNSRYRGRAESDWTAALGLMREGVRPSALVTRRVDLDGVGPLLGRLHEHKAGRVHAPELKALVVVE